MPRYRTIMEKDIIVLAALKIYWTPCPDGFAGSTLAKLARYGYAERRKITATYFMWRITSDGLALLRHKL